MKVPLNLGSVIGSTIPILAGLVFLYFVTNQPQNEHNIHAYSLLKILLPVSCVTGMMGSIIYEEMQKQKKKRLEKQKNASEK